MLLIIGHNWRNSGISVLNTVWSGTVRYHSLISHPTQWFNTQLNDKIILTSKLNYTALRVNQKYWCSKWIKSDTFQNQTELKTEMNNRYHMSLLEMKLIITVLIIPVFLWPQSTQKDRDLTRQTHAELAILRRSTVQVGGVLSSATNHGIVSWSLKWITFLGFRLHLWGRLWRTHHCQCVELFYACLASLANWAKEQWVDSYRHISTIRLYSAIYVGGKITLKYVT